MSELITLTEDTSVAGILNDKRTLILRQGAMDSISIFWYNPKCCSHPNLVTQRGYVVNSVEGYTYQEEDRLITLYPKPKGQQSIDAVNQVLCYFGLNVVYMPRKEKVNLGLNEFKRLAKALGCESILLSGTDPYLVIRGGSGKSGSPIITKMLSDMGVSDPNCKSIAKLIETQGSYIELNGTPLSIGIPIDRI